MYQILTTDFPGGSVTKNLPANIGNRGSIPGLEDLTCRGATKPVLHNKRGHRNEKPTHRN